LATLSSRGAPSRGALSLSCAEAIPAFVPLDPRLYQIATLTALLVYGIAALRFDVRPGHVLAVALGAFGCQWTGDRWKRRAFDPRSAAISALSLCLLLRTESWLLAGAAGVLAVGSKFVIRIRGKHVFNPTNGAIVALLLLTDGVWVSPGQWGSFAFFAFLMACLGGLVVHRAARSDVTYAFLAFYLAIVFGRSLWLGEPLAVPVHRLQNGALLLFAFFMISDPRTTPDSRAGRLLFAALVALGAAYVSFVLFRTNGLLWSLAVLSPLVPLIDRLSPGPRHAWPAAERMLP
jgi:Na+-transporting NADH:ubiquinone oxidoreductase subunit NqrB